MKKTKPSESVDLKASRKFHEKFDKICAKIASTEGAKRQAERRKLVELLESDDAQCRQFLEGVSRADLSFIKPILVEVATKFAGRRFLRALKTLQERLIDEDLTVAMDAAALAYAKRLNDLGASKRDAPEKRAGDLENLKNRASEGDGDALFKLALRVYFGTDVEQDYALARKLGEEAVAKGCEYADLLRELPRPQNA